MSAGIRFLESWESWIFQRDVPPPLQDPQLPIHVKEFWCVIVSVKILGSSWSGKRVKIYCDNDAVCDVISFLKPKDAQMQSLLREFLYWVCLFKFHPVVSKIGTKENFVADFLSRNFSLSDASSFFEKNNLSAMKCVPLDESMFTFKADW